MTLVEELARVKIAEARAEADKQVRQHQFKSTPERTHPLRSLILRLVASARGGASRADEREGRVSRTASR